MESLFCIVGSAGLNTCSNSLVSIDKRLEGIWKKFYNVERFPTLEDLRGFGKAQLEGFERVGQGASRQVVYLNKAIYKKRMKITAELFIREAIDRGKEANKHVFANIVGLGLGVWKIHDCQNLIFSEAFVEVANEMVIDVDDVVLNFSYISLLPQQQRDLEKACRLRILFLDRDLASILPSEYSNHLLVTTYAWDGNSFPGNEIYAGSLSASGDPAANCCCTIFELHNPYINPYCDSLDLDERL
jgi:Domain of unknown function (DUF4804)